MRALAEYPLVSPLFSTVKRYERPLSAASMVAGFVFDNFYFDRVDHPATQIVLAAYLALAVVSIGGLTGGSSWTAEHTEGDIGNGPGPT